MSIQISTEAQSFYGAYNYMHNGCIGYVCALCRVDADACCACYATLVGSLHL
ncbi:Uncharacterized protein APZ42_012458 [Daphnia magna]|uniref:Uncharacterized protein n=1 Tax=Daphnia magna TaxID=35525 RepID=A0A162RTS7_9CRUS|nr:Uncharacterized protein APZ42_012458 [Daphnia magna]